MPATAAAISTMSTMTRSAAIQRFTPRRSILSASGMNVAPSRAANSIGMSSVRRAARTAHRTRTAIASPMNSQLARPNSASQPGTAKAACASAGTAPASPAGDFFPKTSNAHPCPVVHSRQRA